MRVFIDSDESTKSNLGSFYQNPLIDNIGVWLPIKIKKQKKSRWCWAAITSAVAAYYKVGKFSQKYIVDSLLNDFDENLDKYTPEEILDKNINFKLDVALKYIKCFSYWTIGKPSFERIQFEINQGRPFGVRLEWFKGGAHFILIHGYNTKHKTLFILDSIHGRSVVKHDDFPNLYRESGAVWTETFWTTNN